MAVHREDQYRLSAMDASLPGVKIFLRPIAPPAALGLAGFAGSTWIVSSWIAGWWGSPSSPGLFAPFVAFWGGLAQFIAGFLGYPARDTLVTIVHVLWGSFWMSTGLLFMFMVRLLVPTLPLSLLLMPVPVLASWRRADAWPPQSHVGDCIVACCADGFHLVKRKCLLRLSKVHVQLR